MRGAAWPALGQAAHAIVRLCHALHHGQFHPSRQENLGCLGEMARGLLEHAAFRQELPEEGARLAQPAAPWQAPRKLRSPFLQLALHLQRLGQIEPARHPALAHGSTFDRRSRVRRRARPGEAGGRWPSALAKSGLSSTGAQGWPPPRPAGRKTARSCRGRGAPADCSGRAAQFRGTAESPRPTCGVEVLLACEDSARSLPLTSAWDPWAVPAERSLARLLGPAAVLELSPPPHGQRCPVRPLLLRNGRGAHCAHFGRFLPTDRLKLYALARKWSWRADRCSRLSGVILLGGQQLRAAEPGCGDGDEAACRRGPPKSFARRDFGPTAKRFARRRAKSSPGDGRRAGFRPSRPLLAPMNACFGRMRRYRVATNARFPANSGCSLRDRCRSAIRPLRRRRRRSATCALRRLRPFDASGPDFTRQPLTAWR